MAMDLVDLTMDVDTDDEWLSDSGSENEWGSDHDGEGGETLTQWMQRINADKLRWSGQIVHEVARVLEQNEVRAHSHAELPLWARACTGTLLARLGGC